MHFAATAYPAQGYGGNNTQISTKEWVAVENLMQLGRAIVAQALVT
jgi:hypothetical protein